ncbi:MAG: hypothetical protein M1813_007364, partial [Trichoglossum hirsutum]
ICKALNNLLKELDDTYEEAIQRIESQNQDDIELAERFLSWISLAFRPLIVVQLQHPLAIDPKDKDIDKDALPYEEYLVSICAGLVTIDQESNTIRLVHYTIQEYFERICTTWFPYAQTRIAMTCLLYISLDVFAKGPCGSNKELKALLQKYPLFQYAAGHWGDHARGDLEETIEGLALEFVIQGIRQSRYRHIDYHGRDHGLAEDVTGLRIIAYFGLEGNSPATAQTPRRQCRLQGYQRSDSKDNYSRTPLSYAAEGGHEVVVKLLLGAKDVDPNSRNNDSSTSSLLCTARGGHEAVIGLLLSANGVDPNSKNKDGSTPLLYATSGGHEATVKLLLGAKGIDLDSKNNDSSTPLLYAARGGHEAIVKLLLGAKGVDPNSKDKHGRTPLSNAAEGRHEAIVKLLLIVEGIDQDSKSGSGYSPLIYAAQKGHKAIVKLLLSVKGIDLDSKDRYGRMTLTYATMMGHEAIIELLTQLPDINHPPRPPP